MVYTTFEVQSLWSGWVREQVVAYGRRRPGTWTTAIPEDPPQPAGDPEEPDGEPASDPDPSDELFVLGERCASAYLQADALHYEAMRLLAEFHHREGWQDTGFGSTAEWLAWRIGILPGAARERVRTALALQQLPRTSEAMTGGPGVEDVGPKE